MRAWTRFAILLWVLWPCYALALTPGELLSQAQSSYQKGDYAQAVQAWKTLADLGFVNGDLFNNIGSAYWRMGQVGESRLYFLKAQQLKPRDPEIRDNLNFVDEKISPKAEPMTGPWALWKKLPFYRFSLNTKEALWVAALASVMFFLAWGGFRLRKNRGFGILAVVMGLPLSYALFFLAQDVWQNQWRKGLVVLAPKAAIYSAPSSDSKVEQELSEGQLLSKLRGQGDFVLVRSPSGTEAWIESKNIGEL